MRGDVELGVPSDSPAAAATAVALEMSGEDTTPLVTAETEMPIGSQAEGGRDDADAQAEQGTELQAGAADENEGLTDDASGASGTEAAPNTADSGATAGEEG